MRKNSAPFLAALLAAVLLASLCPTPAAAGGPVEPGTLLHVGIDRSGGKGEVSVVLQIFILMTVLSLAPAILIMMTSFIRIAIVLSLLRQALGTHQMPPNQIIIGLALFLTFFVMGPVWDRVNQEALQPYLKKEISQEDALGKAFTPLREFMVRQTREKDLALLLDTAGLKRPIAMDAVPGRVIIPSFVISELKTAFQIGFMIYLPFLVIDMVVSSVLLSMGMMMLPPVMVSLPFKLMIFVLADGWHLIVGSLVKSFS